MSGTCCDATVALVASLAVASACPVCGERYLPDDATRVALVPAAPSAPDVLALAAYAPQETQQRPSLAPDARVSVSHDPRPSSAPPVARLTHVEDAEVVEVRRLLCELRPDKGGPLGWSADGAAPAAGGSAWTPVLRVQTSVEVPAILPGAFASGARESSAPRLDPDSTLGWLQRHGTLAAGLRALYAACADARAAVDVRARWKALPGRQGLAAAVVHGRRLVREAMAEWWATGPVVDDADAAQALRSAQWAEVAGMVARQTERASTATGEAIERVRARVSAADVAEDEGAGG